MSQSLMCLIILQPLRMKRKNRGEVPQGPTNLSEVLSTHVRNARRLFTQHSSTTNKAWPHLPQRGVIVTSSYSGLGTAEMITAEVLRVAGQHLHEDVPLVHYSACDVSEPARRVLMQLPEACRPQHVFGDVHLGFHKPFLCWTTTGGCPPESPCFYDDLSRMPQYYGPIGKACQCGNTTDSFLHALGLLPTPTPQVLDAIPRAILEKLREGEQQRLDNYTTIATCARSVSWTASRVRSLRSGIASFRRSMWTRCVGSCRKPSSSRRHSVTFTRANVVCPRGKVLAESGLMLRGWSLPAPHVWPGQRLGSWPATRMLQVSYS